MIVSVIVLAAILMLCLSYFLALAVAQAELAGKNGQSETDNIGTISQENSAVTSSSEHETTENIEPSASASTEAGANETTAPPVDQTEGSDGLGPNELPLVPYG